MRTEAIWQLFPRTFPQWIPKLKLIHKHVKSLLIMGNRVQGKKARYTLIQSLLR